MISSQPSRRTSPNKLIFRVLSGALQTVRFAARPFLRVGDSVLFPSQMTYYRYFSNNLERYNPKGLSLHFSTVERMRTNCGKGNGWHNYVL